MSLPVSLYSNEYYERLREFRDLALTESHFYGKRKTLGRFTFGTVMARWKAEDDSSIYLKDEGVRYKRTPLTKAYPTTVQIYKSHEGLGTEITTFTMDIDDVGTIDYYHGLLTTPTVLSVIKMERQKRSEEKYGLSAPTLEQRELLYMEMSRGATGLYTLDYEEDEAGE